MPTILILIYFLPFCRFTFTDYCKQRVFNLDILSVAILYFFLNLIKNNLISVINHLFLTLAVYLVLLVTIVFFEKLMNKFLFGGGDIKLLALIVWGFSLKHMILSLFFASSIIIIYFILVFNKKRNSDYLIVFAPYLSLGLLIAIILQDLS